MLDQLLTIKRPELVIVVHDPVPGESPFSRPSPRIVSTMVAKQPSIWGVAKRVQMLLVPPNDRVTNSFTVHESRRVEVNGVDRFYFMVSGHNFSFGKRLRRQFFQPGSAAAMFGPVDGPVVEEMIQKFLDELKRK
ncbi:MAG: hypothetical protein ACK4SL_04515 [Candidatus Paceibacteria bacterium]